MSETFVYANVMDKGRYAERMTMRQATQEQALAERQRQQEKQRLDPQLTQAVAEPTTLRPQIKPELAESVSAKLSEREAFIKQLLERLNDPPDRQQQRKGPSL